MLQAYFLALGTGYKYDREGFRQKYCPIILFEVASQTETLQLKWRLVSYV